MLFQPTSITPDYLGSIGNGIVDPALPFTVSWMVNGNSAMTAFSITIYENTAANTLIYDTGQLTDGCPFYGTDALGNKQFFIYTDESGDIMTALDGYTECKMVITQWWSATESVVQSSPSAFAIKEAPSLTLSIPSPIARRDYTFTANYSQADGDSLNWIRWWIAVNTAEGRENPIYDSGYIYGTALLECYYDGFLNDTSYCVKCEIETQSGITKATDWMSFMCSYTVGTLTGEAHASIADCQRTATKVEWSGFRYIYGEATGKYTIGTSSVTLQSGARVTWDTQNGNPMLLEAPWNFLYSGTVNQADAILFDITDGTTKFRLTYTAASRQLNFYQGSTNLLTVSNVSYTATFRAVITPTALHLGIAQKTGGLYPSSTTYPSSATFPRRSGNNTLDISTTALTYTQTGITSIVIGGVQTCPYIQVVGGTLTQSFITNVLNGTFGGNEMVEGTVFYCDFAGDLNAGSLYINGTKISGWAVYRDQDGKDISMHIADLGINASALYDYSVCSQQGAYSYSIYPIGTDKYITTPLSTESVSPTFWNWAILECSYNDVGFYEVQREFHFGKNLDSGTLSNNNHPNILENFTQFPMVQLSPSRYKTGTLQSFIGTICKGEYQDTISDREAIDALSTTANSLFLKDRKGDIWEIRTAGEITFDTIDNTIQQAVSVSIPWVQIADASETSIIQIIEE